MDDLHFVTEKPGLAITGRGLYYSTIVVESGWSEPCQHSKLDAKLWLREVLMLHSGNLCYRHTSQEESNRSTSLAQEVAKLLVQDQAG